MEAEVEETGARGGGQHVSGDTLLIRTDGETLLGTDKCPVFSSGRGTMALRGLFWGKLLFV